ncbi:L,D-transpeptidase family protein [Knoellia subterranea]|uniref:L,D-TPase catalytic domain-containing protein n=1 Tax=Knoellia subterranea KCTC 19937 TaxID=1385521 RepID=A0A0A0JKE7_9MICO|nr:L,D-transpeptidase family protein [Knoellia subterranea]KGN37920.1 hypothetical protein N803_12730 [Knoellia subterranea KCTC 19937]
MATHTARRTATAALAAGLMLGLAACGTGDSSAGGPIALPDTSSSTTSGSATSSTNGSTASPSGPSASTTAPGTVGPASPTTTAQPGATTGTSKPKPTTASPKPTPTKATPSQTKSPKPKPPTKPEHADLRSGDSGPRVLKLQQELSALGYWLGEPDGDFGHLTQQAVWALQKTAGISRDGRVGPATQRAIDKGVRPSTTLRGNGVDINLKRQILMIVRDGQVRYTLNTSTGGGYKYTQKDGDVVTARTPKGTFSVYYTVDGKDEGFLGDMWRPRYFNGGYAVHGSPSIPAHAASHGCARVSNAAMNMIWARNYMPKGSTVIVR